MDLTIVNLLDIFMLYVDDLKNEDSCIKFAYNREGEKEIQCGENEVEKDI